MSEFARESVEFQGVRVRVDGQEVTVGVELCIIPAGDRPTVWLTPTVVDGKQGIMVQNLQPGQYRIWYRITSTPETVIDVVEETVTIT